MTYSHPLVAATYDVMNGARHDIDFYLDLAAELNAHKVIDLGCGTGVLTVELATQGKEVLGVDPAADMIEIGRARPGGDQVRWLVADSSAIDMTDADLAVMTGNAAQEIIDDTIWGGMLRDLHRSLRTGGVFAFESRDPRGRDWENWRPEAITRVEHPDGRTVEAWNEVLEVSDGTVTMESTFRVVGSDETLTVPGHMRFRTQEELTASLENAGFSVEAVYRDRNRRPVDNEPEELIFLAKRH